MKPPRWQAWWLKVLVITAGMGYQWLVHRAIVTIQPPIVRLALVLPAFFVVAWGVSNARHKYLWFAALTGLTTLIMLVGTHHNSVYGVPHALIYLSLLWIFGRTLVIPGREAFVTRLARKDHGALSPALETYTRNITLVWCIFFAMQLATSALLLTFSSTERWSFFINLLNLPLLVFMFVVEYTYRVLSFPEYSHGSILKSLRVFAQESSAKRY